MAEFLGENPKPSLVTVVTRLSGIMKHLRCEMRTLLVVTLLFADSWLCANPIRSYINEEGVKVYTNVGTARAENSAPESLEELESNDPKYLSLITKFAGQYGVAADLVKAIISVESGYDPRVVSHKGAMGLMQLHPDTARRFGVQKIFDPGENIEGGVKYLQFLMNYFNNDLRLVLAAYNAGENAVTRYRGIPPYRETRDYVKKVTARYDVTPETANTQTTAARQNRRIYRVLQADGRILFTNTPTDILLN